MNDHLHSDLDWQAFAYWADELPPAERLQFEQLLETSQPAREALARAVELSQAVIAVESNVVVPVVHQSPQRTRRIAAWSAGIAASALALLLGFSVSQWSDWGNQLSTAGSSGNKVDPALASAWSDTHATWEEVASWQPLDRSEPAEEGPDNPHSSSTAEWDPADLETPSWMTAAVGGQAAETTEAGADLPASESLPSDSGKES
jgi:hypothetical protein